MNRVEGKIVAIASHGNLSLVSITVDDKMLLKSIVIDTPDTADYLVIGGRINLLFKETEAIIATEEISTISLQNRIPGQIESIDQGALLAKVTLQTDFGRIISIISANAVDSLQLHVGQGAYAMIKLNEMMLSPL